MLAGLRLDSDRYGRGSIQPPSGAVLMNLEPVANARQILRRSVAYP